MADGVEVLNDPPIFSIDLGEDVTLENVGELVIDAISNETPSSISWSPEEGLSCTDCPNPTAQIDRSIVYTVTAINDVGCEASDEIAIILDIDRTIDPASAFTPNGDNNNDIFVVHGNNTIEEIRNIEIYSRTGELVFKQENFPINDINFGWDGTFNGEPLPMQLLAYFMEVRYKDGKTKLFKGEITLIR